MKRALYAAALSLLLACGQAASNGGAEVMVHVGHNSVAPAEVSVPVGGTVVFHNMDEMPGGHTIVADDGAFESPPLGKDEQWSHTFEEAGSFGFGIKQHPDAKGRVVVE